MVAPPGERSSSIAADCFVPGRTAATQLSFWRVLLGFGRLLLEEAAERPAIRLFALFVIGISFGSVATCRLHRRSPAEALCWRGEIPERQKRAGSKHSSAP